MASYLFVSEAVEGKQWLQKLTLLVAVVCSNASPAGLRREEGERKGE